MTKHETLTDIENRANLIMRRLQKLLKGSKRNTPTREMQRAMMIVRFSMQHAVLCVEFNMVMCQPENMGKSQGIDLYKSN
jgi:hypothetical protein